MPEYALKKVVTAVLVVAAFIILAFILMALKVGGGFFYAGCEGEPVGTRCSVGSITNGTIIEGVDCRPGIKTVQAIDSPRCNPYGTKSQCIYTTYAPIKREGQNISVCLWSDTEVNVAGKNIQCFLNAELSCDDFSQATTPKCVDVTGCRGVTAVKRAVEELKPEKCTVGVGSVCLI